MALLGILLGGAKCDGPPGAGADVGDFGGSAVGHHGADVGVVDDAVGHLGADVGALGNAVGHVGEDVGCSALSTLRHTKRNASPISPGTVPRLIVSPSPSSAEAPCLC